MPAFDSPKQLIDWYDNQERVLTPAFLDTIPWQDVKKYEIKDAFIPVLLYFRDIEKFTEVYFNEMKKTPTGRDPVVRQFMEKWQHEEDLHGELMNRFLEEAGYPSEDKWFEKIKKNIPLSYKVSSAMAAMTANLVGKRFSAVHMTWGAINEMTTLTGYRRLWELMEHPVLTYILKAIAREEASHSFFYGSLAKLQLMRSKFTQEIAKFIIDHFWSPVGQGAKPEAYTNYIIRMLFDGKEGVDIMDEFVNKRLQMLPGFEQSTTVKDRITKISLEGRANSI
ncbi:MAG: acyl-ACP desaturase [Candidatus Magasanikbacteria bacterium]|jgi:hypothetical protein|nr:acyl-ACP desaturase [Candidatus Magasanikbacteria bacterium]